MQNSHEIREFVCLYDRIDIMESWTDELENELIELQQQNECYKQRTDLLSTDWLRAAQRPSAISVVRRRGCPKRRNSTQLDVELSWVELCRYKRGLKEHTMQIPNPKILKLWLIFVKPKPKLKPQFFCKLNRKPNQSHFLPTAHPYHKLSISQYVSAQQQHNNAQ